MPNSLRRYVRIVKEHALLSSLVTLSIVGLIASVVLQQYSQDIRQQANTSGEVALWFDAAASYQPGSSVSIPLKATTGTKFVDGFQVKVDFAGTIASDLTFSPATVGGLTPIAPQLTSGESGVIRLFAAFLASLGSSGASGFRASEPIILGYLTFTAPQSGQIDIAYDTQLTKVVETGTGMQLLSPNPISTSRFQSTTTPSSQPSTTPIATPTTPASPLTTPVAVPTPSLSPTPTASPPVGGGPGIPTPTPTILPTTTPTSTGGPRTDPSTAPSSQPSSAPSTAPSTAPSVAPTPTSSTSQPITRTIVLNGRFAGVTKDAGPILTKIQVGTQGSNQAIAEFANAVWLHTSGSTYTTSVSFTSALPDTAKIWISIKGEKHLARIVADVAINTSTVSVPKPMLPGDLGTQDGKVNATDLNLVFAALGQSLQTIDILKVADVNYDGRVNSLDFGLILATLQEATTEE